MDRTVPRNISEEENLLRGIVHPMFYSNSKGTVKREAFLPPPERRDVSLLRRKYAIDDSFCKRHCKSLKIGTNKYVGIAVFLASHITKINNDEDSTIPIIVKATPLSTTGELIPKDEKVYITTPGLPMHADLLYKIALPTKGEPAIEHRVTATKISKKVNFHLDEGPSSDTWEGNELVWEEI
ncbi:hypothetical protein [Membranihabitans maritimus]|uniref:hypothetical protein n=1 Tax=Membranihabitans maritimus TaxID=2904244 RepID=UPI001F32D72B|nr:hypothetical protein [Membranihabitans maritimus]